MMIDIAIVLGLTCLCRLVLAVVMIILAGTGAVTNDA